MQTLSDENPVHVIEPYDVGDRSERHQVEQRRKIRHAALGEAPTLAEECAHRGEHIEHHADAGEMLARKRAARLIGINDQLGRGQLRSRQVMIGDQHLDTACARRDDTVDARDAVVDGDDHRRLALCGERDDLRREPVAELEAVGHEVIDARAHRPQAPHADRARSRAIGIVIRDDQQPLVPLDRGSKPRRRSVDAL